MERVENLLRLVLAPGLGPVTIHRLLAGFGSSEAVLDAPDDELLAVEGVDKRHVRAIRKAVDIDARPELETAAAAGVNVITFDDPTYPPLLREIYDPPCVLYVRGELKPTDGVALGIVGTRRASRYGREQAERFGSLLARSGFTVVSGLARGIDSFAHRGCLAAGGRTLAVVGCGLSHMYPEENRDLAAEIAEHGAVLSEFPMDTTPSRETFPRRNRIIAGLSLGVLVTEAPERSGALITARQTMEMGREVFAVPGRIDQDAAAGCHRLIREGATLVRNLEDILAELGPVPDEVARRAAFTGPRQVDETKPPERGRADLDEREAKVLAAVTTEPIHIDQICAAAALPVHQVSSTLMVLELKRRVKQEPGKFFVKLRD